ncbi:hypothetical protein YIM1640_04640 [Thermus oshimai]|uniref:hypothetical protein n=1 Tax=Thermus oshimai TaxID=56957 RepID=UPI0003706478|nr:hypothetical protein [Thermus oshimai]
MRALALLLFLGLALAQSLLTPPEARVGEAVEIRGENLPNGRFPLALEGPEGSEALEVEVREGSFRLPFTPKAPGAYRFRLALPSGVLEARLEALAPQAPELLERGLSLPGGVLPLPEGPWLGPLVQGDRVYVARGLLVLEVAQDRPEVLRFHFAPGRVLALRPGPEALLEGERALPLPFPPLPFSGKEEDLKELGALLEALKPPRPWPYFAYWALPPESLTEEDLKAYGEDLRLRGHRPELPFGQEGVLRMAEAASLLQEKDPEKARLLAEALLRHTPLFPGSLAFFERFAEGLEAQGHPAGALRFREALKVLRTWLPPDLSPLREGLLLLGLAYLALFLYLFLYHLPAQLKDLKPLGGYLGGWLRHPLLRLRHLHLAYASFGERLLALGLLLLLGAGVLLQGLDGRVRAQLFAPPLDQGTLRTEAAQAWLMDLPPLPEVRALQGYALLGENPKEAKALLQEGATLPFAQALLGEEGALAEAYRKAPHAGPIRSALGLGEDPWGPREPGPSAATLYRALFRVELTRFLEDPLRGFLALGLPLDLPGWGRVALFLAFFLLLLYHLLSFFLPRRPHAPPWGWALWVRLLFPGSLGFAGGLGLLLLLLAAYGLLRLLQGEGPGLLLLAYGLHLLFLVGSLRRPG